MTNAIMIGLMIYDRLMNDTSISEHVGEKIFPIVAENETTFPFITYTRTNVASAHGSKDGYAEDVVRFQIVIASDTYTQSVEIANRVRQLFEFNRLISSNMTIYNSHMVGNTETFGDNTYVQTLQFDCTVS